MTIRKTAYDTLACEGTMLPKYQLALKNVESHGGLVRAFNNELLLLQGADTFSLSVPKFLHPMPLRLYDEDKLVVNLRPYVAIDRVTQETKPRDVNEYELALNVGKLNSLWIHNGPQYFFSLPAIGVGLFATWISENVGGRYGLDEFDRLKLSIASAFFYFSNMTDETEINKRDLDKMAGLILNVVKRSKPEHVYGFLETHTYIKDPNEFVEVVKNYIGSVALDDFNRAILVTILASTWSNPADQERLAVALEHPPTWVAIAYTALSNPRYKNTSIGRMSERAAKERGGKDFVQSVENLLNQHN